MKGLRDKIASTIYGMCHANMHGSEETADAILALIASEPSKLVAVRECTSINHDGYGGPSDCSLCHGTGTIRRTLTKEEVLEWAAQIILPNDGKWRYLLPSGERLEVKK